MPSAGGQPGEAIVVTEIYHLEDVVDFVWLSDSTLIVSSSKHDASTICMLNLETYICDPIIELPYVTVRLVLSPDNQMLAFIGQNQVLHVVDIASEQIVVQAGDTDDYYSDVDWSHNGQWLAVDALNRVDIFDTQTWQIIRTINLQYSSSVSWSPDDRYLAVGASTGSNIYPLDIIEFESGVVVYTGATGHPAFWLSGSTIMVSTPGEINVVDVLSGSVLYMHPGYTTAWTGDSRYFLTQISSTAGLALIDVSVNRIVWKQSLNSGHNRVLKWSQDEAFFGSLRESGLFIYQVEWPDGE
jgi:WD40 repeat protein